MEVSDFSSGNLNVTLNVHLYCLKGLKTAKLSKHWKIIENLSKYVIVRVAIHMLFYLLRGDEPPLCDYCFVPLTVCHFLCPTHTVQRRRFFGFDCVLRPVPLRSILRDTEDAVLVLLGFLVSIGLINSL